MLLEARRVSRWYDLGARQVLALEPITVSLKQGDFLALTGPSGSGKSTLLNLLSGLDVPSAGKVLLNKHSIHNQSAERLARLRNKHFGYMFQSPHALRNRSVFDNVALPFRYANHDQREHAQRRTRELLEFVGLTSFADMKPATLSGGELQRLAFARALALDPPIIFADEPTASLDDVNAQHLLSLLAQQANNGKLVVMATHDPLARSFAHREIRLQKVADALA